MLLLRIYFNDVSLHFVEKAPTFTIIVNRKEYEKFCI